MIGAWPNFMYQNFTMTKMLVTGGAGFIESHLCESLINAINFCLVVFFLIMYAGLVVK